MTFQFSILLAMIVNIIANVILWTIRIGVIVARLLAFLSLKVRISLSFLHFCVISRQSYLFIFLLVVFSFAPSLLALLQVVLRSRLFPCLAVMPGFSGILDHVI